MRWPNQVRLRVNLFKCSVETAAGTTALPESDAPIVPYKQATMLTKASIRREALARRRNLPNRRELSAEIVERLLELPALASASTVLCYVSARTEVETHGLIARILETGWRVAIPYCVENRLQMWRIESLPELVPGAYGILEPPLAERDLPSRRILPATIKVAIIPGVAFDKTGGRVGFGAGYFDRLLAELNPQAEIIAPAFECQLFDAAPMEPHDRRVDVVVTEGGVWRSLAEKSRAPSNLRRHHG